MADNKKYYYLKLKENFYDSEQMIILQDMPDGYLYSDILLKLYLKSLKSDGRLMFNDKIPYSPQMIATITRHQIGTVERALKLFRELGLIDILDNGAIYMADIQNFIGKSSTEGDRKREYRNKISQEKQLIGQMGGQMSDKRTPEIERELEIENRDNKLNSKEFNLINIWEKNERCQCLTNSKQQCERKATYEINGKRYCNQHSKPVIEKIINPNNENKIYQKYGKYQRIKLTKEEYEKLCSEFGKEFIDNQIILVDEYVESNNNKNKYSNFNLVIRKSIKDGWFTKRVPQRTENPVPEWFNKDVKITSISEEDKQELENLLKEFK